MNELFLPNDSMPRLLSCGQLTAQEPFYHLERVTDYDVLVYVISGTIYVTEDETDIAVGGGGVYTLRHGVRHYGRREIARGTEWCYAHFALPKTHGGPVMELPKTLADVRPSRAAALFSELIDAFRSNEPERKWHENALLFSLLSEVAFRHRRDLLPRTVSDDVCAYLAEHMTEPFSAAAVSERFFLSYKHLAHLFRRDKGMTMQQFHTRCRIEHAQRLLLSTLMPIGEIARAVGYADMLYFSRIFRRFTGVSPSGYRREADHCIL